MFSPTDEASLADALIPYINNLLIDQKMLLTAQTMFIIIGYSILALAVFIAIRRNDPEYENLFTNYAFSSKIVAFAFTIMYTVMLALSVQCLSTGNCMLWTWIVCVYLIVFPIIIYINFYSELLTFLGVTKNP